MGELVRKGYPADHVRLLAEYGRILRVRRGWYACNDVDPLAIRACRVGGRLACVSALAFHGLCPAEAGRLHVGVPRTASRLRDALTYKEKSAGETEIAVILHWSRREPTGDRLAVSVSEALAQAHACHRR